MNNTFELEKILGVHFENKDLLLQALCHRSYLNENPDFKLGNNERLEFLGDAVLELIVTEYLFENYPQDPEGVLTNWRAALVNTKILSKTAKELKILDFILLSKGEQNGAGKAKQYILADVFEALTGAIYLDQGYEKAKEFIKEKLLVKLPRIIELELFKDPKSELQEIAQEKRGVTPVYRVLEKDGPDHQKHFKIGVFLGEELLSIGDGQSKKEAEERAAQMALEEKFKIKKNDKN